MKVKRRENEHSYSKSKKHKTEGGINDKSRKRDTEENNSHRKNSLDKDEYGRVKRPEPNEYNYKHRNTDKHYKNDLSRLEDLEDSTYSD